MIVNAVLSLYGVINIATIFLLISSIGKTPPKISLQQGLTMIVVVMFLILWLCALGWQSEGDLPEQSLIAVLIFMNAVGLMRYTKKIEAPPRELTPARAGLAVLNLMVLVTVTGALVILRGF